MTDPSPDITGESPRTYRSGPSDPVRFTDGPGTWAETPVAAPIEDVWAAVTDINLPARFSGEFLGARWKTTGPAPGACFVGRNRHPAVGEWRTESFVTEFEPHRVFGWAVSDPDNPGARWRFVLDPSGPSGDRCRLRFEVTLGPGPSGTTAAIAAMPDKESRIIHRRLNELHANMARTVAGIRDLIEARR